MKGETNNKGLNRSYVPEDVWGSGSIALRILKLGTRRRWGSGQLHVPVAIPPEKEPPVFSGEEPEWIGEQIWTQRWRRRKSVHCSFRKWNLIVQPVA